MGECCDPDQVHVPPGALGAEDQGEEGEDQAPGGGPAGFEQEAEGYYQHAVTEQVKAEQCGLQES